MTNSTCMRWEFPLPPPLAYEIPGNPQITDDNQRRFAKLIVAFYHHCQKFSQPLYSTSNRISSYQIDLSKKAVQWRNQTTLTVIKAVSVAICQDKTSCREDWTFFLSIEGQPLSQTFTLLNEKIIPLKHLPLALLDGNECEVRRFSRETSSELSDKEWDNWKVNMESAADTYRTIIYPIFHRALQSVCPSLEHRRYSIFDIGGGNGELALSLLDQCPHIESYTILERNQESVDLAAQRQKCDCAFFTDARKKLRVIQGDATKIDLLETNERKTVEVIILCGMIAKQVLSEVDSANLLQNCKKLLKDKGFVLIASHTSGYFDSSDYERMGWKVLNKSFQYLEDPKEAKFRSEPFYVLTLKK